VVECLIFDGVDDMNLKNIMNDYILDLMITRKKMFFKDEVDYPAINLKTQRLNAQGDPMIINQIVQE
jgi:hypothetical protein